MENARGDVVGDKTFGSGSIPKVIDMPDGSALILSVAKYYTPSGKAIQDTAVTPNILVADNNDDFIAPDEDDNADDDAQQEKQQKTNQPDDQLEQGHPGAEDPGNQGIKFSGTGASSTGVNLRGFLFWRFPLKPSPSPPAAFPTPSSA